MVIRGVQVMLFSWTLWKFGPASGMEMIDKAMGKDEQMQRNPVAIDSGKWVWT